jgi:glyoxylase-like metal-dependent hydrolase (beta-lactamase superfamily II)
VTGERVACRLVHAHPDHVSGGRLFAPGPPCGAPVEFPWNEGAPDSVTCADCLTLLRWEVRKAELARQNPEESE